MFKIKNRNTITFIFLFIFSLLNYNTNFLHVAGTENFYNIPSSNSEIETTDGIIYGLESGEFLLGRYARENFKNWQDPLKYREFFHEKIKGDEFRKYITSYGLQVKIYGKLHQNLGFSLKDLHLINSIIFSLITSLFLIFLQKNFSYKQSLIFALAIATSPWIIAHAKDIRWITWSWYLPLFSLVAYNYFFDLKKKINIFIWLPIVYLAVLLRCLFGYEYISTILSITFFYFIFLLLKLNYTYLKVTLFSFLLSFVLLMSFLSSFIFSNNIEIYSNLPKLESVKTRILLNVGIVEKEKLEKYPCLSRSFLSKSDIQKNCGGPQTEYYTSFDEISRLEVLGRYIIFRNLFPYVGALEVYLDDNIKNFLKEIFWERKYYKIKFLHEEIKLTSFLPIFSVFIQTLFFIFIIYYSFYKVIKFGDVAEKVLIFGSFISSISWFVLAKNYSYVHLHLCYIAWYLSFIPFSYALILKNDNEK